MIKRKLEYNIKISHELYNQCLKDNFTVDDPSKWLFNQEYNIKDWINYKDIIDSLPEFVKNDLMEKSFYKYNEFMYINYPYNYGKLYKKAFIYSDKVDIVDIYIKSNEIIDIE